MIYKKKSYSKIDKNYLNYIKDIKKLSKIGFKNIVPFLVNEWKNYSGYIYFLANNSNGKKIFIKSRGILDSAKREYQIVKLLWKYDNNHFCKQYSSKVTSNIKYVATEKIDGVRLDLLIFSKRINKKNNTFKKKLFKGLFQILKILHKKKIVHRDIRPQNIIVRKDGTPILIDFQFAIDVERIKFHEYSAYHKRLAGLGREYAKNKYHWDDAYSVNKILEDLNFINDSEFILIKRKVERLIGVYEIISTKNNYLSKKLTLIKNSIPKVNPNFKIIFYQLLFFFTSYKKFLKKINKARTNY